MTTQASRAWANKTEYVVCMANGVFVVFDYQHRVAQVAQFFEGLNQTYVVAMVQSDRGLIEDVKNAAQP